MSDAIRFLDALGRAPVSVVQSSGFTDMLDTLELDDGEREALVARDASALSALLQARPAMFCLVATPEDEPGLDENEPLDAPDTGGDDGDRDGKSEQAG